MAAAMRTTSDRKPQCRQCQEHTAVYQHSRYLAGLDKTKKVVFLRTWAQTASHCAAAQEGALKSAAGHTPGQPPPADQASHWHAGSTTQPCDKTVSWHACASAHLTPSSSENATTCTGVASSCCSWPLPAGSSRDRLSGWPVPAAAAASCSAAVLTSPFAMAACRVARCGRTCSAWVVCQEQQQQQQKPL